MLQKGKFFTLLISQQAQGTPTRAKFVAGWQPTVTWRFLQSFRCFFLFLNTTNNGEEPYSFCKAGPELKKLRTTLEVSFYLLNTTHNERNITSYDFLFFLFVSCRTLSRTRERKVWIRSVLKIICFIFQKQTAT